jgi:hypothetical protein
LTLAILLFLILACIIYIIVGFNQPIQEMTLNLGGKKENGIFFPDFNRDDIKLFIKECEDSGISKNIVKDFILSMYNTLYFKNEPSMPSIAESRYDNWELDDDIEDFINYIFNKYHIKKIRWNQTDILELNTMLDILNYLSNKIKVET